MTAPLIPTPAPTLSWNARAWLLIDKATGKERLIDGAKHNPADLQFWVSYEAMASCDIVPLFRSDLNQSGPTTARAMQDAVEALTLVSRSGCLDRFMDAVVSDTLKRTKAAIAYEAMK